MLLLFLLHNSKYWPDSLSVWSNVKLSLFSFCGPHSTHHHAPSTENLTIAFVLLAGFYDLRRQFRRASQLLGQLGKTLLLPLLLWPYTMLRPLHCYCCSILCFVGVFSAFVKFRFFCFFVLDVRVLNWNYNFDQKRWLINELIKSELCSHVGPCSPPIC